MERLIHKQMLFSQGRVAQFFFHGGGGAQRHVRCH